MAKFRVVWLITACEEDWIDAASEDEAKSKWDALGIDGELFFIEDENGNQVIYG